MDNLQIFSGPKSAKYGYQLNPYNTMIGALYEYHIAVKKIKRPMSDTERREWEAMVCGKLWYGSILINVCSAVPAVIFRNIRSSPEIKAGWIKRSQAGCTNSCSISLTTECGCQELLPRYTIKNLPQAAKTPEGAEK